MSNTTTIVFVETSNQYIITLPKALMEALKWKKGDRVEFTVEAKDDNLRVMMTKAEPKEVKEEQVH